MVATHKIGWPCPQPTALLIAAAPLLLLAACAIPPPPPPAPYLNAADECGRRNLSPEAYRNCADVIEMGNGIRRDMEDNAAIQQEHAAARLLSQPAPYVPPMVYAPPPYEPPPGMPPPMSAPVSDVCSMMSCPHAAPPPVQYVPIAPGDPLNAGLNSYGYPNR